MNMKKPSTGKKTHGLLAFVATFALAACALAFPAAAWADNVVAHTVDASGNRTNYTNIAAAKTAGYAGATIIMDADWDLGGDKLVIADSKSLSIDMNGHRITSSNIDATIYVNEHASFSLTSSAKATEFSFKGFNRTGRSGDFTVSSGGLISNTDDGEAGLGQTIHVEAYAHLELENVAVVGGGECGLYINSDCSVDLLRATVCHNGKAEGNKERQGGGINLSGNSTLTLTESHVDDNYSNCFGGGIYVGIRSSVFIEEGSTVSRNWALSAGGGIYVHADDYLIKSADGTGTISENGTYDHGATIYKKKRSGGGIYVNDISGRDLKGTIEGLIIKDNYSAYDGGGLELDQKNTTVRNCIITGNYAARDGGGVCVYAKGITFEGCTITDNYCDAGGGAHEGGGIFVSYHYDLNVKGKNIIKGNTRGKGTGNADDVFLSTVSGNTGRAYIKGTLEQGSSVGVRTGIEGDRRIAEEFKPESKDCLFMDLGGYYVSYGTDEGGDAWQRHTTKEFTATVNGQSAVKYRQGAKATLTAPAAIGDDLVFWHWDLDKTTGLYPIGDYITDDAAFDNTLSFAMPQNDVDAVPVYVTRAKKVAIALDAPVAGEALPAAATLYRLDGAGLRGPFGAAVAWYEVGADGSRAEASGTAKAGTAYAAEITVEGSSYYGLYFNASIAAGDVTLKAGDADGPAVESASVDSGTGALTVRTAAFGKTAEAKPTVTSVEGVTVSVAATESEQVLRDLLPATAHATTDAGTTVSLTVKKDGFDLGSLIQNGCVVPPAGSDTAVLEIPVESADGSVTVPEGTTVKVTVKITGNGEDGDGPEIPVFPDVDYSQWYADGVAFCSGNGLMTGYDDGSFGVGRSLTRAELAAILWRVADPAAAQACANDEANATGMADLADNAWYTGAANWAVKVGVINGFDEGDHREFRPDAPVTAEQLAAILANYADPDGAAFADLGVLAGFADADAVSDWARASVAWAKGKGIVNGYDAGYYRLLMPQEEIPRERVATILMNAFEGGVLR